MKARRTIWTPMQIENLRRLIKEYSVQEVAQIMNVTENAVNTACTKFGISRATIRVKWSKEEDQFLIRNAGFMSIQRMADMLGRSYAAVQNRACMHLNISLKLK